MNISWLLHQISGNKFGVSEEKSRTSLMEILLLQWKSGVSVKNLGSLLKIWGLYWKSGVSIENLGSRLKIWGRFPSKYVNGSISYFCLHVKTGFKLCNMQLQYTVRKKYDRKVWKSNKCSALLGWAVYCGKFKTVDIKKYKDQEPPYPMCQIRVLQWVGGDQNEEISGNASFSKLKVFPWKKRQFFRF